MKNIGAIGVIELKMIFMLSNWEFCVENGVWLRPFFYSIIVSYNISQKKASKITKTMILGYKIFGKK